MASPQDIVLFDGDCAYCNGWVKWIAARDRALRFRYVALESEEGQRLQQAHHVPPGTDSVVLVQGGTAYLRSSAAWRILKALPGHRAVALLLRAIPRPLRDLGYDLIARNRHRLGLKDTCDVPPPSGSSSDKDRP